MRFLKTSSLTLLAILLGATTCYADFEWEKTTTYYEDDAWYDVSEWFDGNDYNPTDEEFGEWDDEVFQWDPDEIDIDNDWNYGYATVNDDDWFYDYYDEGVYSYYDYGDDLYDFGSRFYDYDNDGTYDAYAAWYDWDSDGLFDDYNYYSFNEAASAKQERQAKEQAPTESRKQQVSGEIQNVKQVQVRGHKNLVVAVRQDVDELYVDLGPANDLDQYDIAKGQQITATGPKVKVGEKPLVVAQTMELNGKQVQIDRSRRQIQGKVADTRRVQLWGREHLIAMVQPQDQKGKVAVDLGPADRLKANVQKGGLLSFRGVPVKVQDKKFLMASAVQQDNEWMPIDRRKQQKQNQR